MAGSWLFYAVSVLLVYFAVSIRALSDEAEKIRRSLEEGDLVNARNDLAMIVGRDTGGLDAPEVTRAAVETVAESTMDGIVAPLFYAFLGGPVLLWVYKTVNTLDSMVGYKNARFKEFGWAAARVDGWMNLIPSKITSLLISAAMLFCGRNFWGAAKRACGYIFKGPAVNSQGVEDAMAGGLGVRLGGRSFYQGEPEDKPLLGETSNPLNLSHIRQAATVSYIASALMLAGGLVILRGYC
jgi:adenosylcobinamide-phosphate synthase